MKSNDNQNLERVIADIATIKSVLNKNKMILQQIMIPGHLIAVAAIGGVAIIMICLAIHLLLGHYGAFSHIPAHLRYSIYGLIAAITVLSAIAKLNNQ